MKTCLDCIPCFMRQSLEACRLAGLSSGRQKQAMDALCRFLPKVSFRASPPELARHFYQAVYRETGRRDPYLALKRQSNRYALKLYGRLKKYVSSSRDRLRAGVEVAIAGNIIDFGAKSSLDVKKARRTLFSRGVLKIPRGRGPHFQLQRFKKALRRARTLLYLADNAGETVFDRVLIEEILRGSRPKDVVYAVKHTAVINDALVADAVAAGIDRCARIVTTGTDAPGAVLPLCSAEFRRLFRSADLVISKGQGNYESLSGVQRRVFFLLTIKCPVVARDVGGRVGEAVLLERA